LSYLNINYKFENSLGKKVIQFFI